MSSSSSEHEHEPMAHTDAERALETATHSREQQEDPLDAETRKLLHDERSCIFETRVESASKCRDRGSDAFKRKDVSAAIQWYERALFHVDFDEGTWHFEFLDKHRDAVNAVRLPVYLNLAACYLHATHEDLAKVIENADLALAIDSENAKALYRGGRAHLLRDDLDAAKTKLTRAAKNQPNDRAIREALATLKLKLAEQKEKDKQTWGGRLASPAPASSPSAAAAAAGMKEHRDVSSSDASENACEHTQAQTSSAMFWIVALLVLVLAGVAGVLFVQ